MKKKQLPTLVINQELWNKIMQYSSHKEKVDSISMYLCGYNDKNVVRYCNNNDSPRLIAQGKFIYYIANGVGVKDGWKQYVCRLDVNQKEPIIEEDYSPIDALLQTTREMKKYYSDEEIENIYKSHQCSENEANILHYNILTTGGRRKDVIYKFTNCRYYDLNGAYASMLISMFPKCKDIWSYQFEHRHDNHNKYKNKFNYFVGQLTQNKKNYINGKPTRNIHPLTRFWIIKSITDRMYEGMKIEGVDRKDNCIYVNTDGFILQNPKCKLNTSKNMGDFKLEYEGDIYMVRTHNGWVMQYGDEVKGSIYKSIRDDIDLRKGKCIEYDLDKDGNAVNIKEKHYETITIN